ncbi:hypothetical protein BSK62_13110 [Paenibacillus odorifer]|uniref:helix-turn-helix domain-containing protein n=1 Tax=Paenibacillus odorifer TaxID=189426 RepID=UPI00096BDDDF|nr:helix-turn-helix transcriptional regulator [Paenibacillus odorifer]OMD66001.1 hypothetical protein BSK62_13110 [Paenibacillus odorifer]
MDIFSARLKWLRERKSLTQNEVAELIGMSRPGYTKIEQGQREPKLEVLALLPKIFDESVDFMLGVTDFTQNCQRIKDKFDDASAQLSIIKFDLQQIQINPHSRNIITKDFDPDDSESVKAKIEFIQKNLPLYEDRLKIAKNKLLALLDEVPLVKLETYADIEHGDPFKID